MSRFFQPSGWRWRKSWLGALLLILWHVSAQATQVSSVDELTLAYLYNFLKYTEWPGDAGLSELTLCVSEKARFDANLWRLSAKMAQNKKIMIKRLGVTESPLACHLLFVNQDNNDLQLQDWLRQTANMPILMVGDTENFLDVGGMIILVEEEGRLRFEINLDNVKNAGLKLSSEMLKMAREVRAK
jgi:YfiR/HmsC-like